MDSVRVATSSAFTFTTPASITGTAAEDAEAPKVERSGDNVFILWHERSVAGGELDVYLARSTNRGATFGPRINLSNSPVRSADEDIAVTRSGNNTRVYVVWTEGDGEIRFRRDRTNDGTFASSVLLHDPVAAGAGAVPRITASGDHAFVVWQAPPQAGADDDIFFARSTDAGDTFKDKLNISNSNPGMSFDPAIALVGDDRVVVTWRDSSGGDFEIFHARGQ